ncbi:uncharacterized protein LOC121875365 [Homarus americanus]|uniref:uncharacterized protein LOC121875365 n=1 Tax=Homarus americanus TaxID=6706 RepID=UPI001C4447C9|nr:uncharacterized protein LOC121875365 [Homarus americanus]
MGRISKQKEARRKRLSLLRGNLRKLKDGNGESVVPPTAPPHSTTTTTRLPSSDTRQQEIHPSTAKKIEMVMTSPTSNQPTLEKYIKGKQSLQISTDENNVLCQLSDAHNTAALRKTLMGVQKAGTEMITQKTNVFLDADYLKSALRMLHCKDCDGEVEVLVKQICLDILLSVRCKECGNVVLETRPKLMNVYKTKNEEKIYENNLSLVLTLASYDVSYKGFLDFIESMKIKGMSYKAWLTHIRYIHSALKKKCDAMFVNTKQAIVKVYTEMGRHPDAGGILDIDVSYESSWLTHEDISYCGVIVVKELHSDIVLDWECMSKYCQACIKKKGHERSQMCREGNCGFNDTGERGGIEAVGAQSLCSRSLDRYKVRYVAFLTDRDSEICDNIMKMNNGEGPYDAEHPVIKADCVNHFIKQLGTALYKVKDEMVQMKWPDLTQEVVGYLQSLCETALRDCIEKTPNKVREVQSAIISSYFHCISTDDMPDSHLSCPKGLASWCFWQKARARKETPPPHEKANMLLNSRDFTMEMSDRLAAVYVKLADDEFVNRCRLVKTQVTGKSLSGQIWQKYKKERFRGVEKLKFAADLTCFEWNIGYTEGGLHKELGLRYTPEGARMKELMERNRMTTKHMKKFKNLLTTSEATVPIQQPDAGPTTPSTSEDGVPPGSNKGRPANKTRKRKILTQDVTQIQTEDQDEQQSGPRTKRKGSKEKTSESQREETLDKEVLVQPNTCTHKHNIHVDVSSKGWQVFGIPIKEENSDSDGFNEELQGKIKEIDEIVKEEEVYCNEGLSWENPDQGLKVKEEDLDNYAFVKVGIEDSDESKKEDTTDGDLYVTVGIHDV